MPEDGLLSRYTRQLKAANVGKTTPTPVGKDDETRRARSARPRLRSRPPDRGVLIVQEGTQDERVFEVGRDRTTIGRSRQCDIALDDHAVSRTHAIVTCDEAGTYRLCDQGSINGTYVNEQRISEHALEDGDIIQVGLSVLAFRQA
jgi:FHA domain